MILIRNQLIPVSFTEKYLICWQVELYLEEAPTERQVEITVIPRCV